MSDRLDLAIKELNEEQRAFLESYISIRLANLRQSSSGGVLEVFEALREMVSKAEGPGPESHPFGGNELKADPPSRRRKRERDLTGPRLRSE